MDLLSILILKVNLLPLVFNLSNIYSSQFSGFLNPFTKLIQYFLMIVGFLDPELKSFLSFSYSFKPFFLLFFIFSLLLLIFLNILSNRLVIFQFVNEDLLLNFKMLIVFQKLSKICYWKLRLFVINMSEPFCNDIADDGIIFKIIYRFWHSNEVI